jgi:hypothetical protein
MGERIFSKVQYGIEAANAHGTAVAATKVLVGADIKAIPQHFKPTYPEDGLGIRMKSARSVVTSYLVEDSIAVSRMYFEGLPFFLDCGLKGNTTGNTTNGVVTWTFTPNLNSTNNPDTFTLEAGDDTQAFTLSYGMFKSLKLSGEIDQGGGESAVKLDAAYFASKVDKDTFTGNLSLGTFTPMSAKRTQLYLDDTWAAIGNTVINSTLRGYDIELNFGNHQKLLGSDSLYFDAVGEGYLDAMVTLTLEGNSAAVGIYDDWVAQNYQALRLKMIGPNITNTNTAHSLTVDVYGTWESVTPLSGESNNNNLYQALFHGLATSDLAHGFDCVLVTGSNTL